MSHSDSNVLAIQRALNSAGYAVKADGQMGSKTAAAVVKALGDLATVKSQLASMAAQLANANGMIAELNTKLAEITAKANVIDAIKLAVDKLGDDIQAVLAKLFASGGMADK